MNSTLTAAIRIRELERENAELRFWIGELRNALLAMPDVPQATAPNGPDYVSQWRYTLAPTTPAEAAMSEDTNLVQELRAQIHDVMRENAEQREQIAQRDRWITELRSTVAALLGNTPYPLHIRPRGRNFLHSTSE